MLERVASQWLFVLRSALAPLDLTHAQFRLLTAAAWLSGRGPGVRQSDIATLAGADTVMTSEVLRVLESRGLVARTAHPTDGRAKEITVTEEGSALAKRATQVASAIEERFFETGMVEFGSVAKALKRGGRGGRGAG
jgi:DNA-binding MarR family transcriptional regulator